MSYEPPSLAPLMITPDLAAQARANVGSEAPPAQSPSSGGSESQGLADLQAMFPDYDREVLAVILSDHDGNVENAVTQLLQMAEGGDGIGGGGGGGGGESGVMDADEELAWALMQQFASDLEEQLGEEIPPEIRSDPVRYEAFVKERFTAALQSSNDSELTRRANNLVDRCATHEIDVIMQP